MKRRNEGDNEGEVTTSSSSSSLQRPQFEYVQDDATAIPAVGSHHNGSIQTYLHHKYIKLHALNNQTAYSATSVSALFRQCNFHVNGRTNPPLQDIRRLVTLHGGEFSAIKTSSVTHVICEYLTDAQLKHELKVTHHTVSNNRSSRNKSSSGNNGNAHGLFKKSHREVYYVRVQWLLDSIEQGKMLSEYDYMPKGLKGRYGGDIKQHLLTGVQSSVCSSSSCNSDQSSSINDSAARENAGKSKSMISLLTPPEVCAPKQSKDIIDIISSPEDELIKPSEELSFSQLEFLREIPDDLRREALLQLGIEDRQTSLSLSAKNEETSGYTVNKSSSSLNRTNENTEESIYHDEEMIKRLQELVSKIHSTSYSTREITRAIVSYTISTLQDMCNSASDDEKINQLGGTLCLYCLYLVEQDLLEYIKVIFKTTKDQIVMVLEEWHPSVAKRLVLFQNKLLRVVNSSIKKKYGCYLAVA